MASSRLERQFAADWTVRFPELPFQREYVLPAWQLWAAEQKAMRLRKRAVPMRADFAWPLARVAVEIQGGTWGRGGHSTGGGIERDCIKTALAQLDGWVLVPMVPAMLTSPHRWLERLAMGIRMRTPAHE